MRSTNKINLLYVTSHADRWISFEWLCQYLDSDKFTVTFVILNMGGSTLASFLRATGVRVIELDYPIDGAARLRKLLTNIKTIRKIARLCRQYQVDIIHVHFKFICMVSLLGGLLGGVKMRLHTRHYADPGFNLWQYQLSVSMINALSQKIIAPAEEVKRYMVTKERVAEDKVEVIYHGFDLDKFSEVTPQRVTAMGQKHQISRKGPVIGVMSRFHWIKGIQFIIPAFKQLLERYPDAQLVLASAWGGDFDQITRQLTDSLPPHSYLTLPFEADIFALFPNFDVFIHVPIEPALEAFGQVYVEALAAGVPSIFTLSGVATEVMVHQHNAWLVSPQNSEEIASGMCAILEDKALQQRLISNGKQLVEQHFDIVKTTRSLALFYQSLISQQSLALSSNKKYANKNHQD